MLSQLRCSDKAQAIRNKQRVFMLSQLRCSDKAQATKHALHMNVS